jgi:hypothetical protein
MGTESGWNAAQVLLRLRGSPAKCQLEAARLAHAAFLLGGIFLLFATLLLALLGVVLLRGILGERHRHGAESDRQGKHQRCESLHRCRSPLDSTISFSSAVNHSEPDMKGTGIDN